MKYRLQGFSLFLVSALFYDRLKLTFAFKDWSRPSVEHRDLQASQVQVSEVAFVYTEHLEATTVAIGW